MSDITGNVNVNNQQFRYPCQGETLQKNLEDVRAILRTGEYKFIVSSSVDEVSHTEDTMPVLFEVHTASHMRVVYQTLTEQTKIMQSSKLLEFVQVLNFMKLDCGDSNSKLVSNFLDKHKVREQYMVPGFF